MYHIYHYISYVLLQTIITAQSIGEVFVTLSSVVAVINSTVDQSPDNIGIISGICSDTEDLINSGNFTADKQVSVM